MQSEKIGNLEEAISYIKKICKRSRYHSDTMYWKLKEKCESEIVNKAYAFFMKSKYINDKMCLDLLKEVCKKRYYGIRRYKDYCARKHIRVSNVHNYRADEEIEVFKKFLIILNEKYKFRENKEEKIAGKIRLNGFPCTYMANYLGGENYD